MKLSLLKINFALAFVLVALCLPLTSCSDSKDEPKKEDNEDVNYYDIPPITFNLDIRDSQGHNLLNPENDGNFFGKEIKVEFDGKFYTVDWNGSVNKSRALPAVFEGLKLNGSKNPESYLLTFGEFSPTENHDFTINLLLPGYDEKYSIRLVNKFRWASDRDHDIERYFYLNGEPCDKNSFSIRIVVP